MEKPSKLEGTYKIKPEFAYLYTKAHNSFAYEAMEKPEESKFVFIFPVHTLKTGKVTTFKQQGRHCTNIPSNHLERID